MLQHRSASSSRLSVKVNRIYLEHTPTRLNRDNRRPANIAFLRPPFAVTPSTENYRFPSTTPFGLALGVNSPAPINVWTGTLGLPASGLFTRFIVTYVSIRTSDTSSNPHRPPSQAYRTLPYPTTHQRRCRSFGAWFSPVTSSAQADSTSELLRFL